MQSSTILADGEDSKRLEDSVTPLAKTSETNEEEQPKESSNISSKALRILPSLKRNVGGVSFRKIMNQLKKELQFFKAKTNWKSSYRLPQPTYELQTAWTCVPLY